MIKTLLDMASAPYKAAGYTRYQWVRGKLRGDPIFKALLEHTVFPDNARILDLGCGKGLLAAWLLAAEKMAHDNMWLGATRPPRNLKFRGIDLSDSDVRCGNSALTPLYNDRVQLISADIRSMEIQSADAVVLLDVLHYLSHNDQEQLFDKIRASLATGSVLLTRVSDARSTLRSMLTSLVDRCVLIARGVGATPLFFRSLPEWIDSLERRGFTVTAIPVSQSTAANVMLVARLL